MPRVVRDDPENPDPGFAELYANLPEATDLEPWLSLSRLASPPVLYLGIGSGRLAVPLARAGVQLVGVDAHPGMLVTAAERLPGVPLHRARVEELDLGRRFELVIVPSNILNTPERLSAAARHVAPDGRLAFELMNPHWMLAGAAKGFRLKSFTDPVARVEIDYPGGFVQEAEVVVIWPEEVEDFLAAGGLELVRMHGEGDDIAAAPTFHVIARGRPATGG